MAARDASEHDTWINVQHVELRVTPNGAIGESVHNLLDALAFTVPTYVELPIAEAPDGTRGPGRRRCRTSEVPHRSRRRSRAGTAGRRDRRGSPASRPVQAHRWPAPCAAHPRRSERSAAPRSAQRPGRHRRGDRGRRGHRSRRASASPTTPTGCLTQLRHRRRWRHPASLHVVRLVQHRRSPTTNWCATEWWRSHDQLVGRGCRRLRLLSRRPAHGAWPSLPADDSAHVVTRIGDQVLDLHGVAMSETRAR